MSGSTTHGHTILTASATSKARSILVFGLFGLAIAALGLPWSARAATVPGVTDGALSVDQTGAANYSIPIRVPPGVAGMQPSLSLDYSSGGGNGTLGVSWSIGGGSAITRCARTPVQDGQWGGINFDAGDRFCLDGQRLVAVSGVYGANGTEYRTEIDSFSRIKSFGAAGAGPAWFRMWTRSGQIMDYGNSADSRAEAVGRADARLWALNRVADTVGNVMDFGYFEDMATGAHRITAIDYGRNTTAATANTAFVRFVYEARPDVRKGFTKGSVTVLDQRLARVDTYAGGVAAGNLVTQYRLAYETGPTTGRSRLTGVTECDSAGSLANCLTPISFVWAASAKGWVASPAHQAPFLTAIQDVYTPGGRSGGEFLDVNGDGLLDFVKAVHINGAASRTTWLNTGNGWEESPAYRSPLDFNKFWTVTTTTKWCLTYNPRNDTCTGWQTQTTTTRHHRHLGVRFADLNGDGLVDMVRNRWVNSTSRDRAAYLNTGNGWISAPEFIPPDPNWTSADGHDDVGLRFVDLNGDGRVDMVKNRYFNGSVEQSAFLNTGSGWAAEPAYILPDPNWTSVQDVYTPKGRSYGEFLDVDGDGLLDFVKAVRVEGASVRTTLLNTGAGWQESAAHKSPLDFLRVWTLTTTLCLQWEREGPNCLSWSDPNFTYHNRDLGVRLTDVNGDGQADMVKNRFINIGGQQRAAYLNTGNGWQLVPEFIPPDPTWTVADGYGEVGPRFVDLNGDGRIDMIKNRWIHGSARERAAYLSTGGGWLSAPEYIPPDPNWTSADGHGDVGLHFIDLNGDGLADMIKNRWVPGIVHEVATYLNAGAEEIIVSVTDSLGALTSLTYKPLSDPAVYRPGAGAAWPVQDLHATIKVVAAVETDNGVGGRARVGYAYDNAKFDLTGRGFLGFGQMHVTDTRTGITTSTQYRQDYPFIGQIAFSETYLADGTTQKRVTNTLAVRALNTGKTVFPHVSRSVAESFEVSHGPNNLPVTTATVANTYDDFGYPTQIVVATAGGGQTFTTTTDNIYTNDVVNWHLGRLTRATVRQDLPNLTTATRVSAFAYDPVTGLLSQEVVEPDRPAFRLTTDYLRDVFGNITKTTVSGADIAAHVTTAVFDANGRFPIETINALGHGETRTYDARFGTEKSVTGPNGITTSWVYDGFGRKIRENRAHGTATRWNFGFCNATQPWCEYFVHQFDIIAATNVVIDATKIDWFDALNRVTLEQTRGFDGTGVLVDFRFNARGEVRAVSRPYFAGTPGAEIQWTRTTYDIIGRPKTVTAPDGGVDAVAYNGLTTTTTNALGQTRVGVVNGIGRTVRVTDHLGTSTFFSYHPSGEPATTNVGGGAGGVVTAMTYDIRGRKISMDDPDMGVWTYGYNVLGELLRQTDSKGQVVTTTYDLLGRNKTRTEAEGITTWTYDNALKTAGIGKPDRTSRSQDDYVEEFFYDGLGRLAETAITYEGRRYVTSQTYDAAGRPHVLTYPSVDGPSFPRLIFDEPVDSFRLAVAASGDLVNQPLDGLRFAVENTYNALGYLAAVREHGGSGKILWQAIAADAEGNVTEESLGNGLTTTRGFDPATGRIQSTKVWAGLTPLKDAEYRFDMLGNLKLRADRLQSREEAFTYDGLNRLRTTAVTDPAVLTQLGATNYNYDPLGNITDKSDVGLYSYGGIAAGPHAVTRAGNTNYTYDANGSTTGSRAADTNALLRTTTWSSFNKPARIDDASRLMASAFVYGPNRVRIKQTVYSGVAEIKRITYIGGGFERHAVPGQTDEWKHYIRAGGTVAIYTRVPDGNPATDKTRYLHRDHLGSVDLVTTETGAVAERLSYDAHGKRRAADWQPAGFDILAQETKRGFTGHEHLDSVGLIHMNGRVYDPALGRFLSADPTVQFADNAQSYNRYSYVLNNPLSFTDPSGFGIFKKIKKAFNKAIKSIGNALDRMAQGGYAIKAADEFEAKLLRNRWVALGATTVAAYAAGPYGWLAAGAVSARVAYANGGGLDDQITAFAITAATAYITAEIGAAFTSAINAATSTATQAALFAAKAVAHGVVQGTASVLRGGSFKAGFLAGSIASFAASVAHVTIPGRGQASILARTVVAASAGGAGAELGGGKFVNGAISGAFVNLFNDEAHHLNRPNVTLVIRPIGETGYRHASLFVWEGLQPSVGEIYRQYSLGVGQTSFFGQNSAEFTFITDLDAFRIPSGDVLIFEIAPPPGVSLRDFAYDVVRAGDVYSSAGGYDLFLGPNSNSAAANPVFSAGGLVPIVPNTPALQFFAPGAAVKTNQFWP